MATTTDSHRWHAKLFFNLCPKLSVEQLDKKKKIHYCVSEEHQPPNNINAWKTVQLIHCTVFHFRERRRALMICTYFRSCRRSLALSIVMREVVAAGMMMIGVRDPVEKATLKMV